MVSFCFSLLIYFPFTASCSLILPCPGMAPLQLPSWWCPCPSTGPPRAAVPWGCPYPGMCHPRPQSPQRHLLHHGETPSQAVAPTVPPVPHSCCFFLNMFEWRHHKLLCLVEVLAFNNLLGSVSPPYGTVTAFSSKAHPSSTLLPKLCH